MEENNACKGCSQSDCNSCGESQKKSMLAEENIFSNVKKVIAVMSGKGGVGKSTVTASLAVELARKGYKTGILDADITGPSIPKMFGIHGPAQGDEQGILPTETRTGIRVMSINLLMEEEDAPVIWRGPVIANMVKQFWTDIMWGDLDFLLIDMPPGTGDVPLTVFQSLPVDGTIVVTSPQDLVKMIVNKAVHMAQKMDIPVLGMIENYSYFECPECGGRHAVFGNSKIDETAGKAGLRVLAKLPIRPQTAQMADEGRCEELSNPELQMAAEVLGSLLEEGKEC